MRVLTLFVFLFPWTVKGQDATFQWQDFTIGSPALTIRMPGKPVPQSVTLPEKVLQYIQRYDAYYIKNENQGIVVTISHVTYSDEINADLKGAAEGTIGQWKGTGATVDVQSTLSGNIGGRPGLQVKGLFSMNGQDHLFAVIAIGEGPKLWLLSVLVKARDAKLQEALKTIVDSISFKEK